MNISPKKRTVSINLRVTPEEKAALKKLAASEGITLTQFLVKPCNTMDVRCGADRCRQQLEDVLQRGPAPRL